jgi:hypothetical protein
LDGKEEMIRCTLKVTVALVGLWCGAVLAGSSVNLNAPGVLAGIQKTNPEHYRVITAILEGVQNLPDEKVSQWVQTNFEGKDVDYSRFLLLSDPPKRRLSFELETTHYEALVTLTKVRADMVPAK